MTLLSSYLKCKSVLLSLQQHSDGELNILHSMWHDVKLYPTEGSRAHNVVNMVNEIPRCSRKKYEIATNEGKS